MSEGEVQSSAFKKIGFRVLALMLGTLTAVLLAEIAVRLIVPERFWGFWDATTTWELDAELGWAQKANINLMRRLPFEGRIIRIQTNGDGVAPASVGRQKKPGVLRVLLLGDSAVAASGVAAEERIDAVLQHELRDAGENAEVINAGVNGYSTDQELLLLKRLVPLYKPDIVMVCIDQNDFGANVSQKEYGIPKPVFRMKLDGNLEYVPPNMKGAAIHSFASGPLRLLIVHSALYRLLQPQVWALRSHFLSLQQRNVLGLAPELYYQPDALRSIDWRLFEAMLQEMDRFSRERGAHLLVYLHPAVEEVWEPNIRYNEVRLGLQSEQYDRHAIERQVMRVSEREHIPFCPLIDYFLQRQSNGPFHLLPRDPHCNASGYRVSSEALSGCLRANHFLENDKSAVASGRSEGASETRHP